MQTVFKERLDRQNPVWMSFGPTQQAVDVVESFGHYEAEYAAIRKGVGILHMPWVGLIHVGGSDRLAFLNNMVTHDVKSLTSGQSRRCYLLNKQGRIDADLLVLQEEGNCLLLTDCFASGSVAHELEHYLFAEDVDLKDVTDPWETLGLWGPAAMRVLEAAVGQSELIELAAGRFTELVLQGIKCLLVRQDMGDLLGVLLLIPADELDAVYAHLVEQVGGIVPDIDQAQAGNLTGPKRDLRGRAIGWSAYNTARIESGVPMFRVDFGPDCLPHETSILEQTVSFTKGCYLGQEIVARMQSQGHPKRKLVGIRFESSSLPVAGCPVQTPDGQMIGGITSSTNSPLLGQNAIAIAMMKWGKHRKGTVVQVPSQGKMITGTVCSLKLI